MILDAVDESIEILLGAAVVANEAQYSADWVDSTLTAFTPGSSAGVTNGTTAVEPVPSPAASTQRQLKSLYVYNADTDSITLTVRINHNDADYRIFWKGILCKEEILRYEADNGFSIISASGLPYEGKLAATPNLNPTVIPAMLQRILLGAFGLTHTTALQTVENTAYWTYIGYTLKSFTAKYVEFVVTTVAGAGAQIAEVCLASSVNPPNKANQTLTKLAADGTLDALNATGVKRNTSALNYAVARGIHLWAGIRTAMGGTEPTLMALGGDLNHGIYLSTALAGALTGAGPWTGSVIAQDTASSTTAQGIDLKVTLD